MRSHKTKISHSKTRDFEIRQELVRKLADDYKNDPDHKVIEELGINHGLVRADVAVIDGIMDCYEIKSDRDTLQRLPKQICAYNAVFDKVTLVVGFNHVFDALDMIPDWWGVIIAKIDDRGHIVLSTIREADINTNKDMDSIVRLLWREEALCILKEKRQDAGIHSKPKNAIYERLIDTLDVDELSFKVRQSLRSRPLWRSA